MVIKAMQMYFKAGGRIDHINKFSLHAFAMGNNIFGLGALGGLDQEFRHLVAGLKATNGDVGELTTELLRDTLRLAHPDLHPPERRELATRVTRELRALEPYVFPAPKPREPVFRAAPAATAAHEPTPAAEPSSIPPYPCQACELTYPHYYCTACRTEFERRRDEKLGKRKARRREQQRAWYRTRRDRERNLRRCLGHLPRCATCDATFAPKRKDAKYCTPTCRQRAYRRRVTDKSRLSGEQRNRRNAEAGGGSLDTGPRPGHPLPSHEAQT